MWLVLTEIKFVSLKSVCVKNIDPDIENGMKKRM